jgi:hypothetical protein
MARLFHSKLRKPASEMPCLKYFVNRSVVLQQYREAFKVAISIKDPQTRAFAEEMMRDEFEPFRKYRRVYQQDAEVQANIDYYLAKTRQRIN